jgi:hypothetical protein
MARADCKSFNGKAVTVTKAKTEEEREVDLKRQMGVVTKQAVRAVAQQACLQLQAERRANNATALDVYVQSALTLAQSFVEWT